MAINGIAVLIFIAKGVIYWPQGIVMTVGALVGRVFRGALRAETATGMGAKFRNPGGNGNDSVLFLEGVLFFLKKKKKKKKKKKIFFF